MTLKQGKSNQTYRVEAIHTSLDLERRLEALGAYGWFTDHGHK